MKIRGEIVTKPEEINNEIVSYYENLYKKIERWRPQLKMRDCPKIEEELRSF